jgi:hypothetical protein
MKLVYCRECQDVFKLTTKELRFCECGESAGSYKPDGLHALIYGAAIPLGFDNGSLLRALQQRAPGDFKRPRYGTRFEAFVIPHQTPTVNGGRWT